MHQEQSGRDPTRDSGPTYLGFTAGRVSFSTILLSQCWPGTQCWNGYLTVKFRISYTGNSYLLKLKGISFQRYYV